MEIITPNMVRVKGEEAGFTLRSVSVRSHIVHTHLKHTTW